MEAIYKLPQEARISGELYFRLRSAGIECYMETGLPSDHHPSGFMRVDIAVVHDEKVAVAIEVKKEGCKAGYWTRQARAYRALDRFGIVPIFINSLEDVPHVVSRVESMIGPPLCV